MTTIMVDVENLKLGSIISEDVMANTQYPIAYSESKVSREMLLVFQAFNLKQIPILKDSVLSDPKEKIIQAIQRVEEERKEDFDKQFILSVEQFKMEFLNWEAGAKVDIVKIREMILPLIDEVISDRSKMFRLNNYTSSKEYIYYHSIAVALIAAVIANKMNYNKGDVTQIAIAAVLADCGMAKVNKRIRFKPTVLTEFEFKEVMDHPMQSLKMVKDIQLLKSEMKLAIFQHHERLDGSGYPKGSKGDSISQIAHIIAVADIFHAMTSERLYKPKQSIFKVLELIRESAFGKYKIEVIQALLASATDLPLGTVVELSNSLMATIVFVNKNVITRPVVKVEQTGEIIDLNQKRNLFIHKVYI